MSEPSLQPQTVRGYKLLHEIGAGAFGIVYRAYQPVIGREVAIKIILPRYANHPDFIRRFEAEAQTVAHLEHPYIVPLYDYWREPDNAYLVMRWLRGGSLEERLQDGPLAPADAAGVVDQVAAALYAAHRRHIIHRDIKAANILFDEDKNAYLSDFSVAKDLLTDEEPFTFANSPEYISPEQLLKEALSPQTDQYSLGILIYQMLSGSSPFPQGSPPETMRRHILSEDLPRIASKVPGMPGNIDDVLQRATAKKPDDRYPDIIALARAFHQAVGTTGITVVTAQEAELAGTAVEAEVTAVLNPYKGLRAFQERDADTFFGREILVEELLQRLEEEGEETRFLAVVGPSGSGKSSAVKAGLIPALRGGGIAGSDSWFITEMTPGRDPLRELEAALLRVAVDPPVDLLDCLQDDERGLAVVLEDVLPFDKGDKAPLLLLVDQFEELFTLTADEEKRELFINSLLTALNKPDSRLRVVATLRADFYDRPLQVMGLGELLRQRTEVVLPLTPAELERAITQPAALAGVSLEPGLLAGIMADVSDQPGTLPLMQYALTELFERRENGNMTLAAYHDIGGVSGALGQRADEIYQGLGLAEQEAARQIFLRLVTLGEGAEDTRRRVLREELESIVPSPESGVDSSESAISHSELRIPHTALDKSAIRNPQSEIAAVIDTFGQYRLLTFDRDPATRGPTVEVAHEALLHEWPQLRQWLEESRADVRLQRLLAAETAQWQKSGQDEAYLLRGARLDQYSGWLEQSSVSLTEDEKAFLAASFAAREARQAEEEARRQRELETAQQLAETEKQRAEEQAEAAGRLRRRALILAAALGIAALLALAAIFFANQSSQNALAAEQQTGVLLAQQAETELQNGYYDRAVLLALEALENFPYSAQAERALGRAVSYNRAMQQCPGHASASSGVAWSPDGSLVASIATTTNEVKIWDATTCQEQLAIELPQGITGNMLDMGLSVTWTPDGSGLLTMTGDRYLVGSQDYDLLLWDASSGEQITAVEIPNQTEAELPEATSSFTHYTTGAAVDFNPVNGRLATIGGDDKAIIWDEAIQSPVLILAGHENDVNSVAWSPDGARLATASLDGTVRTWDGQTGEELMRLQEHTDRVNQAVWSPNGDLLASGSYDGQACIWDATSGDLLQCLDAHAGSVWSLAWLADNVRLATGHEDAAIRIWDSQTGELQQTLRGHESLISHLAETPVDGRLVSGGGGGQVRIWNVAASTAAQALPYKNLNGQFDISSDGRFAALPVGDNNFLTEDSLLVTWDLQTGQPAVEGLVPDYDYYWLDLKYSPDDQKILAIGTGAFPDFAPLSTAYVFDAQSGELLKRFTIDDENWLRAVAWSPDGSQVAAGRFFYGETLVWDFQTGELVARLAIDNPEQFNMAGFLEWSPDGSRLAVAYDDSTARVWDTSNWEMLFKVEHEPPTYCWYVRWSPDGSRLLTAAGNDETGAQDTTVRIWDGQSGEEILVIQDHTGQITAADWSPDGARISTTSTDDTTRLWNAENGDELLSLSTPIEFYGVQVWSNNGRDLVVGGLGLPPAVWRVWQSTEELVAYAQECCVFRELTADERVQYGLVDR